MSPRDVFVEAKGCKLFCRVGGAGDPVVVVHGGPGLSHSYLTELSELSYTHQLIFYDQRGSGRSTGELDQMHMDTFIEDLQCIFTALNLKRASLIGHSWGGLLAMKFAIDHPECINKMILINSLPCTQTYDPLQQNLYMEGIYDIQLGISDGYRRLFRQFCHNPKSADMLNLDADPKGIAIRIKFEENFFMQSYNYESQLKQLNIPTLILHGENDLLPFSIAENLHRCIKNSVAITLPNCGHFPNVEQPEILFHHLEKFLI